MTEKFVVVKSLAECMQLAELVAKSGAFADVPSAAKAAIKILAGAEMGFGPFASLADVHFIEGKPSLGAHLRAASIKGSDRYDYEIITCNAVTCELEAWEWTGLTSPKSSIRKGKTGWESKGRIIQTMDEAMASKVAIGRDGKTKANWARHPDDMLFARAVSKLYRRFCPDLTGGVLAYSGDELDPETLEIEAQAERIEIGEGVLQLPAPATNGGQEIPAATRVDQSVNASIQEANRLAKIAPVAAIQQGSAQEANRLVRETLNVRLDRAIRELGMSFEKFTEGLIKNYGANKFQDLSEDKQRLVVGNLEKAAQSRKQAVTQ